jgi:hypothetical protein
MLPVLYSFSYFLDRSLSQTVIFLPLPPESLGLQVCTTIPGYFCKSLGYPTVENVWILMVDSALLLWCMSQVMQTLEKSSVHSWEWQSEKAKHHLSSVPMKDSFDLGTSWKCTRGPEPLFENHGCSQWLYFTDGKSKGHRHKGTCPKVGEKFWDNNNVIRKAVMHWALSRYQAGSSSFHVVVSWNFGTALGVPTPLTLSPERKN